jgi:hypothetical protein
MMMMIGRDGGCLARHLFFPHTNARARNMFFAAPSAPRCACTLSTNYTAAARFASIDLT